MNVLVVGGSGLVGGDIALLLQSQGHEVTIMARKAPETPSLAAIPFMQGDYVNDRFNEGQLEGFDSLVFAAAADIRYMPMDGSMTPEAFYTKVNDEAVPRFFQAAQGAGISRAVYIGSFYAQVAPEKIETCPYVRSRHNTDTAVRALSSDSFKVCSLNAPFVLGQIPGLDVPHIGALVAYAKGEMPDLPVFAPKGGTNHISSRSLAQATLNALQKGEPGKGYLVGDENLSWKEYFELWFEAVGNPINLDVKDDEHPLFPNIIMYAGVGVTVAYEPEDMGLLAYDRNQIQSLAPKIVSSYVS